MYKRPDSDIFGTKLIQASVKINNDSFVDPNSAFKKKNDENYQSYSYKIGNVGRKNIDGNPEMTRVNQKVNFDDEYHKSRKYNDMQSSIFYEPRPQTAQDHRPLKQKNQSCKDLQQVHYGRKNTFKRQIQSLPYNQSHMKGNASQLFDFDTKDQTYTQKKDQPVLIPHQMQWDQHDSIRYQHNKQKNNKNPLIHQSNFLEKTEEAHSTEDKNEVKDRKKQIEQLKNADKKPLKQGKTTKSAKNDGPKETTKEQKSSNITNDIEIKVVKGWDNKYMEGLSKYCKLYSTPMTKFEFQGPGKAVIFLKKTTKWQAVSDWLTKDAKLKIRVVNK